MDFNDRRDNPQGTAWGDVQHADSRGGNGHDIVASLIADHRAAESRHNAAQAVHQAGYENGDDRHWDAVEAHSEASSLHRTAARELERTEPPYNYTDDYTDRANAATARAAGASEAANGPR